MKNPFPIFISVLLLGIFIVSSNSDIMKRLVENRISEKPLLQSYKSYYGILYGFSFLPQFRLELTQESNIEVRKKNLPRKHLLYAICDSQLWNFIPSDSVFDGINRYDFSRWNDWTLQDSLILDSNQTNILLIETDERKLRMFGDTNTILRKLSVQKGGSYKKQTTSSESKDPWSYIFNKNIETNLEFNLFDYGLFLPFKETKAFINDKIFNRIDRDVEISTDKEFLFSKETTDTTLGVSSFNYIPDSEIERIITSINYVSMKYKSKGFDKVYFSFVPNSVTINDPDRGNHNNLIPRIQNHPQNNTAFIDVLTDFSTSNKNLYYKSDTHWNYNGFIIWLNKVNERLDSLEITK